MPLLAKEAASFLNFGIRKITFLALKDNVVGLVGFHYFPTSECTHVPTGPCLSLLYKMLTISLLRRS